MPGLDELSRVIGELQGHVSSLQLSHTAATKELFKKLDAIQVDQINQKVDATKLTVRVGLITAVLAFGFMKGIDIYFKSHGWGH